MAGKVSYHRRDLLKTLSLLPATWMAVGKYEGAVPPLVLSCSTSNDLYKLLVRAAIPVARYGRSEEAVAESAPSSGVLLLAEGYPEKATRLASDAFRIAREKRLRVYVEFPSFVPGLQVGESCSVAKGRYGNLWERIVVSSDAFSPSLEKLSILDFHDARYVPIDFHNADLSLARVAGFDKAVYGLPAEGVKPILFRLPGGDLLVATTKLSQFVTGRYEPVKSWGLVWTWILKWLRPGVPFRLEEFEPAVRPSFGPRQPLPADAERQAFRRGVEWYGRAKLFIHPSWEKTVVERSALDGPSPAPLAGMAPG